MTYDIDKAAKAAFEDSVGGAMFNGLTWEKSSKLLRDRWCHIVRAVMTSLDVPGPQQANMTRIVDTYYDIDETPHCYRDGSGLLYVYHGPVASDHPAGNADSKPRMVLLHKITPEFASTLTVIAQGRFDLFTRIADEDARRALFAKDIVQCAQEITAVLDTTFERPGEYDKVLVWVSDLIARTSSLIFHYYHPFTFAHEYLGFYWEVPEDQTFITPYQEKWTKAQSGC